MFFTLSTKSMVALAGSAAISVLAILVPSPVQQKTVAVDGKVVFAQRCSACHGPNGEGGAAFPKPLTGSKTMAELAVYIKKFMPPEGKKLSAQEATKVAGFAYNCFYSPIARERNAPARISLSRLTVRQFKNALADLVGEFRPVVPIGSERGLQGEYFKARDRSANGRVVQRVDSEVKFDFGTDGPVPGKFDPHAFSVTWQGSVFAPDSGDYDFVVQTDHSAELWINGSRTPLIDASVKSGSQTEYRGTINLIGGRSYALRLDFTKATRGVDDTKQKQGKPAPKAFVNLLWRRPNHVDEVISDRFLFAKPVGRTYVVETKFPPDDRSIGYERGNSVSKEWDEATTSAALEAAETISSNLPSMTGVRDDAKDRFDRLKAFCRRFVERAFRRPLDADAVETYVEKQFRVAPNLETAVKRVVLLTIQSPRFLYREIDAGQKDSFTVASQLSFGLWDTIPDRELLAIAAKNELSSPEQIQGAAERMAKDPRAWNKLRDFLLRWLKVDEVPDIVKNPKKYPDFDAATASDLRTSLELFLEANAWSETSDYRDLLLSQKQFLNGRLAKLYGQRSNGEGTFTEVQLEPDQRAGVLTQPYLLSRFAYLDTSSPIHRGVLIVRNLLGRTLQPPPAAFAPLAPSLHPDWTTRQRVSMQTKPAMCNSCHSVINPLGFTLEKFDAIGRLRQSENYRTRSGKLVSFSGATSLARYIATSDEAHRAFVEKLFQHLVKQPVLAYGPNTIDGLVRKFADNRYSIRSLMVQIMLATTLKDEKVSPKISGTNP